MIVVAVVVGFVVARLARSSSPAMTDADVATVDVSSRCETRSMAVNAWSVKLTSPATRTDAPPSSNPVAAWVVASHLDARCVWRLATPRDPTAHALPDSTGPPSALLT
jgi:hypothetical protein